VHHHTERGAEAGRALVELADYANEGENTDEATNTE
jgi:hypothetical protein